MNKQSLTETAIECVFVHSDILIKRLIDSMDEWTLWTGTACPFRPYRLLCSIVFFNLITLTHRPLRECQLWEPY